MENNEEKKYWGSKFYGSKLNTILLLVLIILMVVAILIMRQNKEIYLGVWQKPVDKTTTINNSNELDYQINQEISSTSPSSLAGMYIFDQSPSNSSVSSIDRNAIIAGQLKYPKSESSNPNPVCGNGNDAVPTCSIFIEDSQGKVRKVSEWPNDSVRQKYTNIFTPYYDDFLKEIRYSPYNFYEKNSARLDGTILTFNSHKKYDCSGYAIQNWQLDLKSMQYAYLGETDAGIPNDCD